MRRQYSGLGILGTYGDFGSIYQQKGNNANRRLKMLRTCPIVKREERRCGVGIVVSARSVAHLEALHSFYVSIFSFLPLYFHFFYNVRRFTPNFPPPFYPQKGRPATNCDRAVYE